MDLYRDNTALLANGNTVNGRTADIHITTHGSNLYYAISGAMGFAGFAFLLWSLFKPRRDRIFHYICAAIVFTASIAYFSMGSNLGFTPIAVEFHRPSRAVVRGKYREIFYVRYIDWFITTPLLLLDLLLTAGIPWPKIIFIIFVDWFMIIMGLIGALVSSRYKFAYFAVGCFAMLYIFYELAWTARRRASALGPDISRTFLTCGVLTLLLWLAYPVAWGLCEGGNYLAPDSEAIFYSVLDFVAKIVFSSLLLFGHRNIDPARLGVAIRDYDHDPGYYRSLHGLEEGEKDPQRKGQSVSTDGTRVERPSEGYIARDRGATTNGAKLSKKQEAGPAMASGSYPRPSGAPPNSAATSELPTTQPTTAAPGVTAPATGAPGALDNAAAGTGTHAANAPATTPATASAAAATAQKQTAHPTTPERNTRSSYIPRPSGTPAGTAAGNGRAADRAAAAAKASTEKGAAGRASLDKANAAGNSRKEVAGASSSPPTQETLLPQLTGTAADTHAKADEAVDSAGPLGHGDEEHRPKTYADAIRAATHGAIGGGDHAT